MLRYIHQKVFTLKIPNFELLPEDLESFFMSWGNRLPQKPITLVTNYFNHFTESVTMIEKYKKLGIVKEFRINRHYGYNSPLVL